MMYEGEIILVDVSNAFNSLNRQSYLHNISYLWPAAAIFVKNCYSPPSRLFLVGGTKINQGKGLLKMIQFQ